MITQKKTRSAVLLVAGLLSICAAGSALVDNDNNGNHYGNNDPGQHYNRSGNCGALPGFYALKAALTAAVEAESSGLDNPEWATLVDRNGVVCAVAYSGSDRSAVWPGSRLISAQKAYAGNAFSTNELALSTANLYSAVQPSGSL